MQRGMGRCSSEPCKEAPMGGPQRGPRELERDIGFEDRIVITEELMIQEALVGQGSPIPRPQTGTGTRLRPVRNLATQQG